MSLDARKFFLMILSAQRFFTSFLLRDLEGIGHGILFSPWTIRSSSQISCQWSPSRSALASLLNKGLPSLFCENTKQSLYCSNFLKLQLYSTLLLRQSPEQTPGIFETITSPITTNDSTLIKKQSSFGFTSCNCLSKNIILRLNCWRQLFLVRKYFFLSYSASPRPKFICANTVSYGNKLYSSSTPLRTVPSLSQSLWRYFMPMTDLTSNQLNADLSIGSSETFIPVRIMPSNIEVTRDHVLLNEFTSWYAASLSFQHLWMSF